MALQEKKERNDVIMELRAQGLSMAKIAEEINKNKSFDSITPQRVWAIVKYRNARSK